jgi:hypothetical protein
MTAQIPDPTVEPVADRDRAAWATPVARLEVSDGGGGGDAGAVTGRRLSGPVQGFGKLWQKTYAVRLAGGVAPEEVIDEWKANYGSFWPAGNRFYAPMSGVQPGEVALISGRAGGLTLSTGVLVLYADDVSFSFMTPEGHPFAGLITFSSHRDGEATVAQVQLLIRAQDPMVELGMAFGGHRKEDRIWEHTLRALARHLGQEVDPVKVVVCVDRRRQWRRFGNLRHDAALYAVSKPFRRRSS